MNKRRQADSPPTVVKPCPRRRNRALLLVSTLALGAWIVFLLLVALRVM